MNTIDLSNEFNGPFHEADYNRLLDAIKELGDISLFRMLEIEAELMSNATEYIERRDHPGMRAVGCTYDFSFTNVWITREDGTLEIELEPMCMSKEGLAFALFETVDEPDRLMVPSEEVYRRAALIRESEGYSERRETAKDWEESVKDEPLDLYHGGTLFDRIELAD